MDKLLNACNPCAGPPSGKRIVSALVFLTAPYFGTIKPGLHPHRSHGNS